VVSMADNGMWHDNDCYYTNRFVCYTDKSDDIGAPPPTQSPLGCPEGFYTSTHEQACYQLVDEPMSWSAAQQYCKNQGNSIQFGWIIIEIIFVVL